MPAPGSGRGHRVAGADVVPVDWRARGRPGGRDPVTQTSDSNVDRDASIESTSRLSSRSSLSYALRSCHQHRAVSSTRAMARLGLSAPGRRASSSRDTRSRGTRGSTRRAPCGSSGRRGGPRSRPARSERVAARAQPPAQVGVLPVQEVALVESADRPNASRRTSMHAPDTQSTVDAARRPSSGSTTLRARHRSRRAAAARSGPVRPNRPVSMSGSPRALPCTEPSGSRMRGPTIAHRGSRLELRAHRRPRRPAPAGSRDS